MAFTLLNEADVAFPGQAEPHSADFAILVAALDGTGVVSGCAVTAQGSPDMTVAVASGSVKIGNTVVAVSGGNSSAMTVDASFDRYYLIEITNAGAIALNAGTAASNPAKPAPTADRVVVAEVYLPANDTAVGSTQITDKRAFVGYVGAEGNETIAGIKTFSGTTTKIADVVRGGPDIDARYHGAVFDGATDDTSAIQAAIDALPSTGGTVVLPRGTGVLNGTLSITKPVNLVGQGAGPSMANVSAAPWNPATSLKRLSGTGNMIAVEDTADLQTSGVRIANLGLDGNDLAAIAIACDRMQGSVIQNVSVRKCTDAALEFRTDDPTGGAATIDCRDNLVENFNAVACDTFIRLKGNSDGSSNSSHNTFIRCFGSFGRSGGSSAPGLDLVDCDNNTFIGMFLFRNSGTGLGVDSKAKARQNYFFHLEASEGGFTARTPDDTTWTAAVIHGLDRGNGQPTVTTESNAEVTWTEDGKNSSGWHLASNLALGSYAVTALAGVFGTTPAAAGTIRLGNTNAVTARNAANSADVDVIKLDSSDRVVLRTGNVIVSSSALVLSAGTNISLATTTGTKIGTATNQLLGFYNATPVVQPAGTTDVLASLVTLGLRAASSNPPLDLGTGTLTAGLVQASTNLAVGGAPSIGGGAGVIGILNASTVPSSNPTGGGILSVESGALKYRGSSGTVTILAAA